MSNATDDNWFEGLDPKDLEDLARLGSDEAARIAAEGEAESKKDRVCLGVITFTINGVVDLNNAFDTGDFDRLHAAVAPFLRTMNAQVRQIGYNPLDGSEYDR